MFAEKAGKMSKNDKITNDTFGVLIGLVLSVLWIFMGLDFGFTFEAADYVCYVLTIGGLRHTIMTILALILIPICAREIRWGFMAAIVLGIATFTLSSIHVVYFLIVTPLGFESQILGPLIWSIIQIVIMVFGYKAQKQLV